MQLKVVALLAALAYALPLVEVHFRLWLWYRATAACVPNPNRGMQLMARWVISPFSTVDEQSLLSSCHPQATSSFFKGIPADEDLNSMTMTRIIVKIMDITGMTTKNAAMITITKSGIRITGARRKTNAARWNTTGMMARSAATTMSIRSGNITRETWTTDRNATRRIMTGMTIRNAATIRITRSGIMMTMMMITTSKSVEKLDINGMMDRSVGLGGNCPATF